MVYLAMVFQGEEGAVTHAWHGEILTFLLLCKLADTTANAPPSHSCAINRFLADQEQRCPPEFGKTQSPAEAEADAKARMMTKLLAFEQQFGSSDKPPGN
ncbi:uncharacterized protein Triagg1_4024 [Trichoderma aggressivum f. europaeum]|uniref:Uncharacterized protein n=1 Tax=Trichoderma aggressivum f. europaeum TaxID=173218 RepID=A0AAE1IHN8_9HYPO|nr:hypothetical protein Triagg1_4024 [Trichoderma aggressivum f. europaeum]